MIVMLKEAETMLCPVGRTSNVDLHCKGADCMAWQFVEDVRRKFTVCDQQEATTEPERPAHVPAHWEWRPADGEDFAHWVQPAKEAEQNRMGCCGMVKGFER